MFNPIINKIKIAISGDQKAFSVEIRMFNVATFISIIVAILSISINIMLDLHYILHIFIGIGAALLCYIYIQSRIYKKPLIWLYIVIAIIIMSISWIYNEGSHGSINYIYILALVIFLSISDRKHHFAISLIVFINLILLYLLEYYIPNAIHPYLSHAIKNSDLLFTFTYVVVFSALVFSALRRNYENEKYIVELQKQKIERQHEHIKDSIIYAQHIQNALLQDITEINNVIPSNFLFYKPKDIVSGDFYWFKNDPFKEDRIICAVADATGHGVPGALMTMLGLTYLNDIVQQVSPLSPNQVLDFMRKKVQTSLHHSEKFMEYRDGIDMGLIIIDCKTKKLEFAGANRPLYIVRNKELIEFKPDRYTLGFNLIKDEGFTNHTFQLEQDDMLYLFSDGYPDQHGGDKNKKFYIGKFKEFLLEIADKDLKEQYKLIENNFTKWKGKREQTDDVLLVGIKPFS